jgi:hypothetical protein
MKSRIKVMSSMTEHSLVQLVTAISSNILHASSILFVSYNGAIMPMSLSLVRNYHTPSEAIRIILSFWVIVYSS